LHELAQLLSNVPRREVGQALEAAATRARLVGELHFVVEFLCS
jgi:hypothetical protein